MVATTARPPLHAADDVVLVEADGTPVGTAPRTSVHDTDTPLHLAFSCYVTDGEGQVLLTRRALDKRTWPGVWTNSCCGHPRPGEAMTDAVRRRLDDELGLDVGALSSVLPDFAYRATDASGIVENEVCPVYVARTHPGSRVIPNASEVMEWRWVSWTALVQAVGAVPFAVSPWAALQVPLLDQVLEAWV
ncbi:MAG: isopentenyl-diphosphate Delta-isomerase [Janthinobacterium lividum]